jgi:hypothetical protein
VHALVEDDAQRIDVRLDQLQPVLVDLAAGIQRRMVERPACITAAR